jgi:hypothetical protein
VSGGYVVAGCMKDKTAPPSEHKVTEERRSIAIAVVRVCVLTEAARRL